MLNKVIVIGGGAAGLMAAGQAAQAGADVTLLEKNERLGKKLAITGKGRCNVTNDTDIQGLVQNMPGNGRFLYSAFSTFDSFALQSFLHNWKVATKVERGQRVFPQSDRSFDIIDGFKRFLNKYHVNVQLNQTVEDLIVTQNTIHGVIINGKKMSADAVIIATGGASYPATGSTGDGYTFAQKLGHNIIKIRPSLVPLETRETWPQEVQGLALKNVEVTLYHKGTACHSLFGEMLFTHFGVSGPVILSLSRHVNTHLPGKYQLSIDLKPSLSSDKLDQRIQRDFKKYHRKQFQNSLVDLLPKRLIPIVVNLSKIDPEKPINQILKQEREQLITTLKQLTLSVSRTRPLSEAIITVGGVDTKTIQPNTMASKLIQGLYFAGEVLDIDGYTGGFNLQAAFSTGYLAGQSAADYVLNYN